MANRRLYYLSGLVSGRILFFYLAWSIVVVVCFGTIGSQSLHNGWQWGGSLSMYSLVWLNGILILALVKLLFTRGERNASECPRLKLHSPKSALSDCFHKCLAASNRHSLCNLLERFVIGYFFIDRDGIIRDANDEFALLRGWKSRSELIGKSVLEIVDPVDVAKAKEHLQRFMDGETVSNAYVLHNQDGTVHYHTAIGYMIREKGETVGAECVVIDTTDQKRIEDHERRHLAKLAQVQRVNSMGKIVSELAHEIAQPLYAITNYSAACSDVVRSGSDLQTDMLVEWMGQITEQTERAAAVVRRLRRFIHKSKSERVEVDLNRRIEDVLHLLAPGAREHSVDIEFHAAASLPSVFVDPIQIDQVTVNLIQNAIEAMSDTPPQERRVMIETVCEGGDTVRVAVRDFGEGIDKNNLDRIFEAFFSTKNEGMGMGLAICRSIMHEHCGRLWPTHNLHRGTTFHFSLPVTPEV